MPTVASLDAVVTVGLFWYCGSVFFISKIEKIKELWDIPKGMEYKIYSY